MENIGWNQAGDLADKHAQASGGLFVKLTGNGDKVVGIFLGEPCAREVHWGGDRYHPCTEDGCSYCEGGKKPSLRVCLNFYVPSEKSLKVIEGGVTWFKDLLKVKEKYGLDKWMFEIERHGEAGDSKTTYTILPEEKLDDDLKKELAKLELHDLVKVVSGDDNDNDTDFDSYDKANKEDRLIDPREASKLVPRLKAMPREATDIFCQKFDVQRIRDLKASDTERAQAFVEHLEGKYTAPKTDKTEEVDPFE